MAFRAFTAEITANPEGRVVWDFGKQHPEGKLRTITAQSVDAT